MFMYKSHVNYLITESSLIGIANYKLIPKKIGKQYPIAIGLSKQTLNIQSFSKQTAST